MTNIGPRAVVERYIDEVLNGHGPARAEDLISNAAFRQRVDSFRAAFPDVAVVADLIIADGEYVAVHATGRGTHRGIFQGAPPTGRRWSATTSGLYRVEDGRIADFWVNWDLLAILEQVGAIQRAGGTSA
ncbi:hypothetical protein BH23CHL7_BH23CHL7_06780 [soil metagenome]